MSRLLFVLGFVLCASWLHAQSNCTYALEIRVIDSETREPLPYALLFVEPSKKNAQTNEKGLSVIKDLCPGRIKISVRHFGCHDKNVELVLSDSLRHLDIALDHSIHQMEELVVSEHRSEGHIGQSAEKLEKMELIRAKGLSLGQTIRSMAGVSLLQSGTGVAKPMVHGMHGNRLLILNNEVRQEGQQWGAEHAPEIDPFLADEITLIRGASSVKYGSEAIGGVLIVKPSALPRSKNLNANVFNVYNSNGRAWVQSGQLSGHFGPRLPLAFRIQGTLRNGGTVSTPSYQLANTGVKELNHSAHLGYMSERFETELFYSRFNTQLGIYQGAHVGSTSDLLSAYQNTQVPDTARFSRVIARPNQDINHELLKFNAKKRLGNLNILEFQYSRQFNRRFEFDRDQSKNPSLRVANKPEFQYFITTHQASLLYKQHYHKHLEGELGVQTTYQYNTYSGRVFVPNFIQQGLGVYAVERYHIGQTNIEGGFRYDHRDFSVYRANNGQIENPKHRYTRPSLSLGMNHSSGPFEWGIHAASAWRPPAINELYSEGLHHGSAGYEIGKANLVAETVYNLSISAGYTSNRFDFELNPYFNYFNNYINLIPTGNNLLTIRGAFPVFEFISQQANIYGLDGHLKLGLSKNFQVEIQGLIIRAIDRERQDWLSLQPSDRVQVQLKYKSPNELWQLLLQSESVSRQTRYPKQSTVVLQDGQVINISDFAPPPAGYNLFHVSLEKTWTFKRHDLLGSISCQNLLNRRYRDYLNRFRYFSDELGRNIQIKLVYQLNKNQ